MKIALTIWEGRISPVFDVAGLVYLVESETGATPRERSLSLKGLSAWEKVALLKDMGVTALICGAISCPVRMVAESHNIQVFPFVTGTYAETLQAWREGRLNEERFLMPGCRRENNNNCHRRGRRFVRET